MYSMCAYVGPVKAPYSNLLGELVVAVLSANSKLAGEREREIVRGREREKERDGERETEIGREGERDGREGGRERDLTMFTH